MTPAEKLKAYQKWTKTSWQEMAEQTGISVETLKNNAAGLHTPNRTNRKELASLMNLTESFFSDETTPYIPTFQCRTTCLLMVFDLIPKIQQINRTDKSGQLTPYIHHLMRKCMDQKLHEDGFYFQPSNDGVYAEPVYFRFPERPDQFECPDYRTQKEMVLALWQACTFAVSRRVVHDTYSYMDRQASSLISELNKELKDAWKSQIQEIYKSIPKSRSGREFASMYHI